LKNHAYIFWATLGEGGLVLSLAAIGWATNQPLIFASLGPTAYELVEQPQLPSARAYNIVAGHLIGLAAGFLAVYMMNAWAAPSVIATGIVSTERIWVCHRSVEMLKACSRLRKYSCIDWRCKSRHESRFAMPTSW